MHQSVAALPLQTNRWYHVAGTCDGQTLRLYVDGVLVDTEDVGSVTLGNSSPLYFSYNNVSGYSYHLTGQMDDVRIWNYARTEEQIRSTIEPHLTGNEAGLVGYWDCNETIGSQSVLDKTANGNNGTLGSTSSVESSDPAWVEHPHPTAEIGDVSPNPRGTPVGPVTVDFSEAVTGVDIADFRLTRDGSPVDLSQLSVAEVAPDQCTLDLSTVTTIPGSYVLTLAAGGSGIRGLTSNYSAFCEDVSTAWDLIPQSLQVTGLVQSATGFVASFSAPLDPSVLNLYDGAGGGLGPADVSLVGATYGAVRGSLVTSADHRQITFVQTGGVLEADTYTVTLKSGANGFREPSGETLDGNSDGTAGDDYTTVFTVTASAHRFASLPDIARGAGQPVNVPAAGSGLPVRIDDAAGVTSLAVDVVYDAALLNVSGAALAAGLPGDWAVDALSTRTEDASTVTTVSVHGTTALSGSHLEIVRLTAAVPASAPYGASQAIRLENVLINGGGIPAVGDVAVHKAAYLGDADASGIHSSADAFLTVQTALGLATGFSAHAWTDPRSVGDADGSGVLSAADAFLIVQEGLQLSEPFVPDNPRITLTHAGGGVDPQFGLEDGIPAEAGGMVTVPVMLDIDPAATNVGGLDFDLFFDADVLTIDVAGGVSAGADTAAGWAVTAQLVQAGHLRVGLVGAAGAPLVPGLREIARLVFEVEAHVDASLRDANPGLGETGLRGNPGLGETGLRECAGHRAGRCAGRRVRVDGGRWESSDRGAERGAGSVLCRLGQRVLAAGKPAGRVGGRHRRGVGWARAGRTGR